MTLVEVKVPDIGDAEEVAVMSVAVKAGDVVRPEQTLITLESDKTTIDIPSDAAGVVQAVQVKEGDKVSAGAVIATLAAENARADAGKRSARDAATAPAPAAVEQKQSSDCLDCDLLVLGAGPGGYSAAFRAADLGLRTVLVERYSTLGGVCLNVGCIPSKALLHTAQVTEAAKALAKCGIVFAAPKIDLDALRAFKAGVVSKLTDGLARLAAVRKVHVITGVGAFADSHHLTVATEAGRRQVHFKQAIIAAGSQSVKLDTLPDDPRIVDSTGALALKQIPRRLLVIGGGIIGLEMATVYAALGAQVDIVEMLDGLMMGADRDLVQVWRQFNAHRFSSVMLKTKTSQVSAEKDGIYVRFEGENAPAGAQRYDLVLVAVGRRPNGQEIGAAQAGVQVNARGFIEVDAQQRTNVPHIFAVGDIVGQPMLAHKAVHEGHIAAQVAAGEKAHFDALQIPSVAYTDPEVAWTGKTEAQCKADGIQYDKAVFPWAASGRALANGRSEGLTKLLFDKRTRRIIGGGIAGLHAGDLISEIGLAIEMGADAIDIGRTIHPHPTLSESIGMAAEVFEGICTDLPPQRK